MQQAKTESLFKGMRLQERELGTEKFGVKL